MMEDMVAEEVKVVEAVKAEAEVEIEEETGVAAHLAEEKKEAAIHAEEINKLHTNKKPRQAGVFYFTIGNQLI